MKSLLDVPIHRSLQGGPAIKVERHPPMELGQIAEGDIGAGVGVDGSMRPDFLIGFSGEKQVLPVHQTLSGPRISNALGIGHQEDVREDAQVRQIDAKGRVPLPAEDRRDRGTSL